MDEKPSTSLDNQDNHEAIQTRLIELAKADPNGISNNGLKQHLADVPLKDLTVVINKLLKSGTFELYKTKGDLLYKYKDKSIPNKGIDTEEKIVYKIIEEAGNKGIWIRDIRQGCNLNLIQLKKILKNLETRKVIKAVNSVAANKKKVYMLFEIEPDRSVVGGTFYEDQEFDIEFVDALAEPCYQFLVKRQENAIKNGGGPLLIRNSSYASAADVLKYISDLKISFVKLSEQDIESILYTICLDCKAERISNGKDQYLYKAVKNFLDVPGLVKSTCGVCPLIDKCKTTGSITPKCCVYLNNWLNEY